MRKLLTLLGCCMIVGSALPALALGSTGSMSGTVTDANTSAPIEGIEVCAWEFEHQFTPGGCEVTDAAGEYTISGLEPGGYAVEFATKHEFDYDQRFSNEKANWPTRDEVVVTAEVTTSGVNAALIPGGAMEGTVTSMK